MSRGTPFLSPAPPSENRPSESEPKSQSDSSDFRRAGDSLPGQRLLTNVTGLTFRPPSGFSESGPLRHVKKLVTGEIFKLGLDFSKFGLGRRLGDVPSTPRSSQITLLRLGLAVGPS